MRGSRLRMGLWGVVIALALLASAQGPIAADGPQDLFTSAYFPNVRSSEVILNAKDGSAPEVQALTISLVQALDLKSHNHPESGPCLGDDVHATYTIRNDEAGPITILPFVQMRCQGCSSGDYWDFGHWEFQTIQPGATYAFNLNSERPLEAGTYEAHVSYCDQSRDECNAGNGWHPIGSSQTFTPGECPGGGGGGGGDDPDPTYRLRVTAGMDISPGTIPSEPSPDADRTVTASFTVKNEGDAGFSGSVRAVVDGVSFGEESVSLSPGQSISYQGTAVLSLGEGDHDVCAQYESGGWHNIESSSAVTCLPVSVVPAADVKILDGTRLEINPQTLEDGGGMVRARFQAHNYGSWGTTERFRAHVLAGPVSFMETGPIDMPAGGTFGSYDDSQRFTQAGVYVVSAEHELESGEWKALIGDNKSWIRVMLPEPDLEDQTGGDQSNGGYQGEPVHTHTGNFVHKRTDLDENAPLIPLDVTRWYNALGADDHQGPFGNGTSWLYGTQIAWRCDKTAVITMADGQVDYYIGIIDPEDPLSMAGDYVGQGETYAALDRDEDGRAKLTFRDQSEMDFDAGGYLVAFRRQQGGEITVERSGAHISRIRHSNGLVLDVGYTGERVASIQSSSGRSLTYNYSPQGDLVEVQRADGSTYEYDYDANHRMIEGRDPLGHAYVRNEYDGEGRVVRQWDHMGHLVTFSYGSVRRYTDALGHVSEHEYDTEGRLIRDTDALGYSILHTYDDRGNVLTRTNRNGDLWQYSYDEQGNLLTESDPLGSLWQYAYDAQGNRIEQVDPLGNVWSYAYDAAGRLMRTEGPLGYVHENAYDATGHLVLERDAQGVETRYEYDAAARPSAVIDPLGGRTTKTYDSSGNLSSYTDANGHTATFRYDTLGRLVESVDPCGAVITLTYDLMGNLLTESDGMGHLRHYAYDDQDRVVSLIDYRGNEKGYGYDALGRLIAVTDTLGYVTTYAYDAVSSRVETRYPDGSSKTATFDGERRLLSETDALGQETSYVYDALGRTVETRKPCDACADGVALTVRTYDALGHLLEQTDPRGAVTAYAYDALGRQVLITNALGITRSLSYNAAGWLLSERDFGGATQNHTYDLMGRRISTTDPLGYVTTTSYDAVGNVLSTVQDCCGYASTFVYDACDRMVRTSDALGQTTSRAYDCVGNLTSSTDARGNTTYYAYDANRNGVAETNPRGATTHYVYDAMNREVGRTDALGGETTTTRDAMGRAVAVTDALGNATQYEYDLAGRRIAETTPLGHRTTYAYDSAGHVVERTDADGADWQYAYDENGNRVREIDPLGGLSETDYDLLNRRTQMTDPMGGTTAWTYDSAGNRISERDARGALRRWSYDAKGQVLEEIDPQGGVHRYGYDERGNRTLEVSPLGHEARYEYDAVNRLVRQTDALGFSRRMAYDANGNRVLESDYRGNETSFGFDEVGNRVSMSDPFGFTTWYGYDALNRLIAETDPLGYSRSIAYDALGHVVTEVDKEGATTRYEYDADGRRTAMVDALGGRWETSYDAAGRPVLETDPLGAAEHTRYDRLGRVRSVVDALGAETKYAYSANGHLIEVSGPEGAIQRYTYDPLGNVLSEQDGNGHVTRYSYSLLGDMLSKTDALGHTWRYGYDAESNRTRLHQPDGTGVLWRYDALGRMIYKGYSARGVVEEWATYSYDADGNRTAMHDKLGDWSYRYDAQSRMVGSTDYAGRTLEYLYDEAGNRSALIYADGTRIAYSHNGLGAITEVAIPRIELGRTRYSYDVLGRRVRTEQGNGATIDSSYDAVGNLSERTQQDERGLTFASSTFEYDLLGRCIIEQESLPQGTLSTTYAYDGLGRLVGSLCDDGSETHYVFDPAGNRRQVFGNRQRDGALEGYRIDYAYDAANHLALEQDNVLGTTTYRYSAKGERVFFEGPGVRQTYDYDVEGHLVKALVEEWSNGQWLAKDKAFVINDYDGDGRRVVRRNREHPAGTPLVRREYLYDDQRGWDVVQVEDISSERVVARFCNDDPLHKLAFFDSTIGFYGSGYIQGDQQGSVLGISGEQGQPLAEDGLMRYSDYGVEQGPSSALQQLPLVDSYTGYESETYTGLQYARNRTYDPRSGTFLTSDPFSAVQNDLLALHRTLYAHADPINGTDPLGLFRWNGDRTGGTVESGDNLWNIAEEYWGSATRSRVYDIQAANPTIEDVNLIYPGQQLKMPVGVSAGTVAREQVESHRSTGTSASECGEKTGGDGGGGTSTPDETEHFMPTSVWLCLRDAPDAEHTALVISGFDSDRLYGGVQTVSLFEPIREIPVLGQAFEDLPVVGKYILAEKIAARIAAGKSASEIGEEVLVDFIAGKLAENDVSGITRTWIRKSLEWALGDVYNRVLGWMGERMDDAELAHEYPYRDLKHCVAKDATGEDSRCFSSYRGLLAEFPGASSLASHLGGGGGSW